MLLDLALFLTNLRLLHVVVMIQDSLLYVNLLSGFKMWIRTMLLDVPMMLNEIWIHRLKLAIENWNLEFLELLLSFCWILIMPLEFIFWFWLFADNTFLCGWLLTHGLIFDRKHLCPWHYRVVVPWYFVAPDNMQVHAIIIYLICRIWLLIMCRDVAV